MQLILAATASQQLGRQGPVLVWWSSHRYWLCERVKRLQLILLFQFSAHLISGADSELGWQHKTDSRVRHGLRLRYVASRVLLIVLHVSLMFAFVFTYVSRRNIFSSQPRDVQLILAATASQQLGQRASLGVVVIASILAV